MKTKDLINKIREWNMNLRKHSPHIPYTKIDGETKDEIIQRLLEFDELKEKIKELKLFLDDVSKYVA